MIMTATDKLTKLFEVCSKKDFEFTYRTEEGDNFITLDLENKKILVNITNPDDKSLDTMIEDILKKLLD